MEIDETITSPDLEGWIGKPDGSWTRIYNEDGQQITTFFRTLSVGELETFRAGFIVGVRHGEESGKQIKSNEIRKVLGI